MSIDEAALRMGLPAVRVERLLEQQADRRTLAEFRVTHVSNERLRQLYHARRRADPSLTVARDRPAGRHVRDPGGAVARAGADRAEDR